MMSTGPSHGRCQLWAGFSLIELMIVMAILAVLAALVAPRIMASLERTRVRTAAGYLAATLKRARTDAIVKREVTSVRLSEKAYSLGGKTLYLPENVVFSAVTGVDREPLEEEEEHKIAFYPAGSSSGGSITISNEEGDINYLIRIEPISGRIKVLTLEESE
jgi:general secretion pathway protein H